MPNTEMVVSLTQTVVAAGFGAFLANFVAELIKGHVRKSQAEAAPKIPGQGPTLM